MEGHAGLTLDDLHDPARLVNYEGPALDRDRPKPPPHAKLSRYVPLSIAEQRHPQGVAIREFMLPDDFIRTDPDRLGPELGELRGQIAEAAALDRATPAQGGGVEEEDDRSAS